MKKVLIITYYWPPAGGAGVQRALKFAKYLPQFGWQPIILTVETPDCPVIDTSLLKDIPPECKVFKTKSLEPFEIYKKFIGKKSSDKIPSDVLASTKNLSITEKISKWVRLNIFIPDAKIGWKYFAVKEARKIIEEENVDIIFSTSPPQTVALIAKSIAKRSKLKWVADFRDPWMEIVHYQNVKRNRITEIIDRKLERSVLKNADALVTISSDIVRLFKSKVGDKKYSIIPNGFDESDFQKTDRNKNDNFTIAYTGVITKSRVPYVLLSALKRMIFEEGLCNIKIDFAGKSCPEFVEAVKENGLSKYINEYGFLPHHESTQILQNADLLLLVVDDVPANKGFLTGKLFEYMGTRRPIFAIGPIDGDANEIIKNSDSGEMVDFNDDEGAYVLLSKMYKEWEEDRSTYTYDVMQYSRKNLTAKLAELFNGAAL